ncbi:P-loop containing nucleoside triphosphate hydrolase protein, partial [Polychytrium aggregatum]|uniref:P-loop containing nucleoside triphosphate hydrolase protein n=1 Tax=Polychytrium aggregatum TaxID=110093 RepID=UPI0022FE11E5
TATQRHPEFASSYFVKLSYSWLSPLLKKGWKSPLQERDIWDVDDRYRASLLSDRFQENWLREVAKHPPSKYPLLAALWATFGWPFALSGLLRIIADSMALISPFILQAILNYLSNIQSPNNTDNGWYGYVLALVLFLVQIIQTLCLQWHFEITAKTGFCVRTALVSGLYRKSLLLSPRARQSFTTGKVLNVMATDTSRIDNSMIWMHLVYAAPFQIVVASALIIWTVGVSGVVAIALLLLYIPVQTFILKKLSIHRSKANQFADKRVKITQESMMGIRVIKSYAWEDSFIKVIEDVRSKELWHIWYYLLAQAYIGGISQTIPALAMILMFISYYQLGNPLTISTVLPALSLVYCLRNPLNQLPGAVPSWVDAWVSSRRVEGFLLAEEISDGPKMIQGSEYAISVQDADFVWDTAESVALDAASKEGDPQIVDSLHSPAPWSLGPITLQIPHGALYAIVGPVGSGKSSLLNALVGEMKRSRGSVFFSGSVGYCPQTAWIQNATLRDNVLFGLPIDDKKYAKVLKCCALERDLQVLPAGDSTEIGERGINLSGGQKQRVNLARAVYFDCDIILMDDPLSAVDAHVGKYLFDNCIKGALSKKTRVLVTHQLSILPKVDYIVVMDQGRVADQGTYESLMQSSGAFSRLMKEFGGVSEREAGDQAEPSSNDDIVAKTESKTDIDLVIEDDHNIPVDVGEDKGNLIVREERNVGAVAGSMYSKYLKMAGGVSMGVLIMSISVLIQGSRIGTDNWLVQWSYSTFRLSLAANEGIFVVLGLCQVVTLVVVGTLFATAGIRAAKTLHDSALRSLFHAPMQFFDQTPLGRITNRFSKDLDTVDTQLSELYRIVIFAFWLIVSNFVMIAIIFPAFLAPLLPALYLYYRLQLYYRSSTRELKRMDSNTRSPLVAQFSETLSGLATIRAYSVQGNFIRNNLRLLDGNNKIYYTSRMIERWLAVRLELLSSLLILMASLLTMLWRYSVAPGFAGLVITYSIQVLSTFNYCIRLMAETEVQMNSTERLIYYVSEIDHEAPYEIQETEPAKTWPESGSLRFVNVELKYRADLPHVLKGISFEAEASKKIGIVGRTGAGKSSIIVALLRLVEISSGRIELDGVDISKLGLKTLRSKIAVIPQDPVLFSGTVRSNLDPFNEYTDQELWECLERSNLKKAVAGTPGQLDSVVTENGENWSTGQRQLFCLARAMLRRAKLVVLDEATASVDLPTDEFIQQAIRQNMAGCTILTIAHRLNTVIDYDRILVLGGGEVIEYDSPAVLLRNIASAFSKMVEETGPSNTEYLRSIALG